MTKTFLCRLLAAASRFAALVPAAVLLGLAGPASAAGDGAQIERQKWSFAGPLGGFDKPQLQRGFQVYQQVCAACHSLKRVNFRNLAEPGGPGFPEDSVKGLAASWPNQIFDGPNDQGLIADGYSDVTVMFADLVNFTQLTESLPPEQMVSLLNQIFSGFDELSEKYNVEKIKTIGDAYMVVGGLNREKTHYTRDIADMALEMRDFVVNHPGLEKYNLSIHTGIATGPVVAGVIGTKRFIYDLWGDTVNIASRLTDEAMPGVIQVDKMTHSRIRDHYAFEPPASIHVKGKGEMVMYRLVSLLSNAA